MTYQGLVGWVLFPLNVTDILTSMFCGYDFIWERWTVNSFRWYCGLNVTPPPRRGSGIRTHVHHGCGVWGGCGTFRGGDLWRSSSRKLGLEALRLDNTCSSHSASWLWTQCDKAIFWFLLPFLPDLLPVSSLPWWMAAFWSCEPKSLCSSLSCLYQGILHSNRKTVYFNCIGFIKTYKQETGQFG